MPRKPCRRTRSSFTSASVHRRGATNPTFRAWPRLVLVLRWCCRRRAPPNGARPLTAGHAPEGRPGQAPAGHPAAAGSPAPVPPAAPAPTPQARRCPAPAHPGVPQGTPLAQPCRAAHAPHDSTAATPPRPCDGPRRTPATPAPHPQATPSRKSPHPRSPAGTDPQPDAPSPTTLRVPLHHGLPTQPRAEPLPPRVQRVRRTTPRPSPHVHRPQLLTPTRKVLHHLRPLPRKPLLDGLAHPSARRHPRPERCPPHLLLQRARHGRRQHRLRSHAPAKPG